MKKLLLSFLFTFSVILLSYNSAFASATIIKGSTQDITVRTDPPGATVYVDGQIRGTTPVTLTLAKGKHSKIAVEKECYQRVELPLEKKYDPVALLNIFWDLSTTDFITGAIWEYAPNSYYIKLKPIKNCKKENK